MTDVFGDVYARAYDELYTDKDYDAECDLLEAIVAAHEPGASSILDLGCGTGAHALRLAARGYRVSGVDRSPAMLERARENARSLTGGEEVGFVLGDLLTVDLGETFDVAVMFFAVLGYQLENADVLAALRTARRHLRPGGLLVFDAWYGPGVLHDPPTDRVKVIDGDRGRVLRTTSTVLDVAHHRCTVRFGVLRIEGDRLVEQTDEEHRMRFFFPLELELFLESCGFSLLRLGAFPEIDRDPDETAWNVICVARANEAAQTGTG